MEFVLNKVALGKDFLLDLLYSHLNIIPLFISITVSNLGNNNRPIGGGSSETPSHLIDINMNIIPYRETTGNFVFLIFNCHGLSSLGCSI
jgi:hypothetical protein